MKKKNLTSLDEHLDQQYGQRGTKKREKFEIGSEAFRIGAMLQLAYEQKGLNKQETAELTRLVKSLIKRLEKNLTDIKFTTLRRIVREGLDGSLAGSNSTPEKFHNFA